MDKLTTKIVWKDRSQRHPRYRKPDVTAEVVTDLNNFRAEDVASLDDTELKNLAIKAHKKAIKAQRQSMVKAWPFIEDVSLVLTHSEVFA